MKRGIRRLLTSITLASLGSIFLQNNCVSQEIADKEWDSFSRPARILEFPTGDSYGGISIQDKPSFEIKRNETEAPLKARGVIRVPQNKFVVFFPNHNFINNPTSLAKLSPDSIDMLVFRHIVIQSEDERKGDPALNYMCRFSGISVLCADRSEVTDEGLRDARKLKSLRSLDLYMSHVEGQFLDQLKDLKQLKRLNLSETNLRKENLSKLSKLPGLTNLAIGKLSLKNEDLAKLEKMNSLRRLSLQSNLDIDDRAVSIILQKFPNLEFIDLRYTNITQAGIKVLQERGVKNIKSSISGIKKEKTSSKETEKQKPHQKNKDIERILAPISKGRGF
ncbi:MAG: hypothetical protein K2Y32_12570 [Candidatus Obscuribacterales bacterium]|nr:hypothetical protein [Candidatus Obscuribacterales bacterium]